MSKISMKIAKPDGNDIKSASRLIDVINIIGNGRSMAVKTPYDVDLDSLIEEGFDPNDINHCRAVVRELVDISEAAPSFQIRVIGGMIYAVMYEKNAIINPDSDVLELHPRFAKCEEELQLLKASNIETELSAARYEFLRKRLETNPESIGIYLRRGINLDDHVDAMIAEDAAKANVAAL